MYNRRTRDRFAGEAREVSLVSASPALQRCYVHRIRDEHHGRPGLLFALAATRVFEGLLYGVSPTHPAAYAAAALLLGSVASVAAWAPARRAARVDPMIALRAE